MSEITRRPPALALSLTSLAGLVTVAAVALGGGLAAAPGALGLVALVPALLRGSRRLLGIATLGLFGGVFLAGLQGAPAEPLLVAAVGGVLVWDVGEHGIGVGDQLGREADSGRVVLVHAAASLSVGAVTAGVGYGAFLAAAGGQPVTALVFLLLGVVALVAALR